MKTTKGTKYTLLRPVCTLFLWMTGMLLISTDAIHAQVDSLNIDNTVSLSGAHRGELGWIDYDNDDDLDLFIIGSTGSSIGQTLIYENDGSGGLTEDGTLPFTDLYSATFEWADFDNDGDLDLLISGTEGSDREAHYYENDGTGGFTASAPANITPVTGELLSGDYDGDGDLDLVVSGWDGSNRITEFFKNDGDGNFTKDNSISITGLTNTSMDFGDYDNDGDLDLVIAGWNGSNRRTWVYDNDGSGGFSQNSSSFTGVRRGHVEWGDYDNDGDLDVIVSGETGSRYAALYVNNSGTFTEDATLTSVEYSASHWGDYDNDGDIDVFVTGSTSNAVSGATSTLYENDGSGNFSANADISIQAVTDGSVAWGDYDNDGDIDLAIMGITNSDTVALVYENIPLSTGSSPSVPSGLAASSSVDTLTISWSPSTDADGGTLSYNVFIEDSTGASSAGMPAQADTSSGYRRIVRLGNAQQDTTFRIRLNSGTYNWGVQAIDGSYKSSVFADGGSISIVNNPPAAPELISVTESNNQVTILWNANTESDLSSYSVYQQTDSTTTPSNVIATVTDTTYTTGHLAADTYYFYVSATDNADQESELSDWDSVTVNNALPATPSGFAITNGYEEIDLIWNTVADTDLNTYRLYQETDSSATPSNVIANPTDTTFTVSTLSTDTTYYFYVSAVDSAGQESALSDSVFATPLRIPFTENTALRDFGVNDHFNDILYSRVNFSDANADGYLDVIYSVQTRISDIPEGQSVLRLNKGDGTFAASTISFNTYSDNSFIPSGYIEGSISAGDYDGDGDIDIVFTGSDANEDNASDLYENDNSGEFNKSELSLTGFVNSGSDWGDYDNDGDLDLALLGNASGSSSSVIYANNGSGGLSDSGISVALSNTSKAEWVDYDNDGDLDLLRIGSSTNTLYENDGNGGLSDSGESISGGFQSWFSWGDYDNDGDLDVLVARSTNILYENNGSGSFSNSGVSLPSNQGYAVEFADFDNDGDLDFAIGGEGSSEYTRLYENDGSGGFSEITAVSLIGTGEDGSLAWADYDNDNDLDLFIFSSQTGEVYVYDNRVAHKGSAPGAPTNLATSVNGDILSFSWDAATDTDGGPLSYHVYMYNTDSSKYVIPTISNTKNGNLWQMERGNAGLKTWHKIRTNNLPDGSYTWGVQAIDGSFKASAFATDSDIKMNGFFTILDSRVLAYTDSAYTFSSGFISLGSSYADSSLTLSVENSISGILFVDADDDFEFDSGVETEVDGTGIDFADLDTDSLRYYSESPGVENIVFKLAAASKQSTSTIQVLVNETAPEISDADSSNGWHLLANPLQTTLGELFDNIWTQGAVNSDAPGASATLYTFNQDSSVYEAITSDLDATTLEAGTGILAYIFADDDNDGGTPLVNGGWPKTLSNIGNPFDEEVAIRIKNHDKDGSGFTSGSEGFALIGNPFGYGLSIDSVTATLRRLDQYANSYVYQWNATEERYELSFSGAIDPYESFFVRSITSGLDDSLRFDFDDASATAPAETSAKELARDRFKFTLSHAKEGLESESYLMFNDKASVGIDPLDGYHLGSYAQKYAMLYSKVADQHLMINNLPGFMDEEIEIPFYLDATVTGAFDLNWEGELPGGISFILKEVESGKSINLKEERKFSFNIPEEHGSQGKGGSQPEPLFILTVRPGIGTDIEGDLGIPNDVELFQNYPNPFNPSSVIRFGVPTTSKIQLEVFDILGRKVATLLDGESRQPGRYNVRFDARDLSSGMYIYRLVIGDKVLTRKMTLIK